MRRSASAFELWPTAYRVAQGHRLRMQVSSGAFPRWARNSGSVGPLGETTELRAAEQRIYHAPGCASAIMLPMIA